MAAIAVWAIVSNQVVEVHAVTNYYIQQDDVVKDTSESNDEQQENDEIALSNEPEIIYVITADTANIRSGPSTDFEVIATVTRGEVYSGTDNEETAENGNVWYEIYLDDEHSNLGWASSSIIEKREVLPINKLVGVWHGEQGSELTLEENGICYYKDGVSGEGEGTWEIDIQAYLHINCVAFYYDIYAVLNDGYDTTTIILKADSRNWMDEVFSK